VKNIIIENDTCGMWDVKRKFEIYGLGEYTHLDETIVI